MSSQINYVLAGDIGGTNMRAALADRTGSLVASGSVATEPERGFELAEDRLRALFEEMASGVPRDEVGGVVISSAGPIDPGTGIYVYPPNLPGWHGKTMQPGLAESLDMRVTIGHDATLGALAESRYGAGKGAHHLVYVTLSTGVGGGIIANGQMVTGANGHAGEMGHLLVRPGGQSCNVGCDGCLEGIASGGGIARAAQAGIEAGRDTSIIGMSGGDAAAVNAAMVFEAAAAGDALAVEIVDIVIDAVASGFADILNTLDPEYLVVGGGVTGSLQPYWSDLHALIEEKALPHFKGRVPLHVSPLGDDVSLVGAAAYAFDLADSKSG